MAITYPLSLPTDIGIAEIELRASNVVGISESPFTYKQQVVQHQGQRWEASVSIPAVRKDLMEPWIAFLLKLKGVGEIAVVNESDAIGGIHIKRLNFLF